MRKILAVALALLMIVSIVPMTIFSANAAEVASLSFSTAGVEIIENDESTLAPGVTLNKLIAYDKNRQRVEMYVTRADTTVETVKVYANYINNQNAVLGMQTLTEQVAAMEANYPEPFRVVAGINASYYNISNGKPTGAFVMEGSDITNEAEGNNYPFFAVLKDGTYMIGAKGEYSSYKGQIKEAVGGYIHIVKNGAVVAGLEKAKYPRQTLGLTADGQLILMTADGSRTPATIGLTVEEQAQVMLDMGCVEAIHLDGGNSAMLGTIPEGSDEFVLTNFPPSGAERAVSNTLVIVSTAISDGTFDHSVITGEYDYFLPNSTYEFSATGVDAAGGPADIPESVTWGLSDSSFGAVEDGVFTSNGTLGEVDIQMLNEGKVVGTKTIYVVNPDEITFGATEKTVPYTKSAPLVVSALYGEYDVYATADAFDFTLSNAAAGSFSGFNFTATDNETITQTTVTATYKYDAELAAATVIVKFGKGSEILFDFEDGDVSDWQGLDTISEWIDEENAKVPGDAIHKINTLKQYNNDTQILGGETFLSSKENGTPVKNGENSLGLTFKKVYNEDVGGWNYNYLYYTGDPIVFRDLANGKTATKIGMWMYFPPEAYGLYARICHTYGNGAPSSTGYAYYQSDYGAISNFKNMP
ncbi:MAG: phosphodiester glycosidase family protein, partial [Oscillospiraceae bacterium]|nr:phosphodiester glycosidase family protein [Oscillospiraceae bacterium]